MDPMTIAAGASAVGGLMGYKGNKAAANQAKAAAEYNAQVAENEAVILAQNKRNEEKVLRRQSSRLVASQVVAASASGVQMTGSPLQALFDSFNATEMDAAMIQRASSIEQMAKVSEAAISRSTGQAQAAGFQTAAMTSLLNAGTGIANAQQQQSLIAQQQDYYKRMIEA